MNRYPEIFTEVKTKYPTPRRILSFGCSTGEECITLHTYFPRSRVIGFDIDNKIIEQNKIQNKHENIEYHDKVTSIKTTLSIRKFCIMCMA
jgi:chemotaxis methyl-accepting protein methylase